MIVMAHRVCLYVSQTYVNVAHCMSIVTMPHMHRAVTTTTTMMVHSVCHVSTTKYYKDITIDELISSFHFVCVGSYTAIKD